MRITVECGGFTRAADACRTANQTSAVLTETLADRLAGCSGMAGNDATSIDFARAYDAGAAEALAALADLTHSFIGAGRLLDRTADNHALAEAAAAGRVSAYVGGSLDADSFVRVGPAAPPSSLGGQEPSLGVVDRWILDQLEGFVWPSADEALLRAAGSAWRRAAASTAGLADHVDAAVALLEAQRSPEVPLAVDALTDLATVIGDVAWQLSSLATACEDYADAVEDARSRTRALLSEVAQIVVEGVAISALITGISGGLGGGAAAAAAVARVRAVAPRFYAILVAVRTTAAAAAARIERAADELAALRARVAKFLKIPVRDEIGSAKHPLVWFSPRKSGWLRQHEVPGHTIERHVSKSEQELVERLQGPTTRRKASTFDDESTAERLIAAVLQRRSADVDAWAKTGSERLTLIEEMGKRTGTTLTRDGSAYVPTGLRVVLEADASTPTGWRILTAFPD